MGCWLRPYCQPCTENEEAFGISPWQTEDERLAARAAIPVIKVGGVEDILAYLEEDE